VEEVAQHNPKLGVRLYGHDEIEPPMATILIGLPRPDGPVRVTVGVSPQFVLDLFQVIVHPQELEPPGRPSIGHDLLLEGDAAQQRQHAETDNAAEKGTPRGNPDPEAQGCLS
jgi:hypothetical protein